MKISTNDEIVINLLTKKVIGKAKQVKEES